MPKFVKAGVPVPGSKCPAHPFLEQASWPFPPGFEVRAFAMEHRSPGKLLRLATFVIRDGVVDRVEYSTDNLEAVVGGLGYSLLEDVRIRINEAQHPGLTRKD